MWMGRRSWLDGCIYFHINHNCQHLSGCALLIEELSLPISQLVGVETGIRQGNLIPFERFYLPGIDNHLIRRQRIINFNYVW